MIPAGGFAEPTPELLGKDDARLCLAQHHDLINCYDARCS